MDGWNRLDPAQPPDIGTVTALVGNPLWDQLLAYLREGYRTEPVIEYSGCGMAPGWNVKFKKGGRGLCTLYPRQGGFVALVVIGQKEKTEAELALPTFTPYTQDLYRSTKEGMGQRWLMFDVRDAATLADVKRCIAIRRAVK